MPHKMNLGQNASQQARPFGLPGVPCAMQRLGAVAAAMPRHDVEDPARLQSIAVETVAGSCVGRESRRLPDAR